MINSLKLYVFIEVFVINIVVLFMCLYSFYLVFKFVFIKKDMFPIKKYPSKEIVIFNRKTTVINIVFLPILIIVIFFGIKSVINGFIIYRKDYEMGYLMGEFRLDRMNKSPGTYYYVENMLLTNLTTGEQIHLATLDRIKEVGACYKMQYYKNIELGAFIKKIDCVTKETLESYCDLDVCK